jgi:hypothetical protein
MTNKISNEMYEMYQRLHEWEKEALLQASVAFDKSIITLSSALIGFAFGIVKFVEHSTLSCVCLLKGSIILAIGAILSTLASFLCDQEHSVLSMEHVQKILDTRIHSDQKPHWVSNWMRWFGFIALGFFIFAMMTFAIFAIVNI